VNGLRRLLLSLTVVLLVAVPLMASDVTGFWKSSREVPGGVKIDTFFTLAQSGNTITGVVHYHWADLPIQKGVINGNRIKFQCWDPTNPFRYEGVIAGDELQLILHDPNVPDVQLTAHRASRGEMKPAAAIPPPPLRELPANGLAMTPPMGWNSWNHFHDTVTDEIIRRAADVMVSSGMRDAGYLYINIDDAWEGGRDAQGNLIPNSKFPDMKALADYVHSKGLKLGVYSSPGKTTCGGYEGSYGHEEQDARTFAAWGVDYLKYDWCSAFRLYKETDMRAIYQRMGEALQKTDRPIVYSLCQYGLQNVWEWGPKVGGNLWRTTGDISDHWRPMENIGFEQQLPLARWAAPGHWNDPDMLEIGNGGMTADEYRTHMSLWSLLSAPLLAGNDLQKMSPETISILTNREVIAIDQDSLGRQAERVWKQDSLEAWSKPLADGSVAVGFFNRGKSPAQISVRWPELGLRPMMSARDLWVHDNPRVSKKGLSMQVAGHGVVLLKLSAK
jgi:alpha-galactosidase